jgi:hypothetical protein
MKRQSVAGVGQFGKFIIYNIPYTTFHNIREEAVHAKKI